MNTMKDLKSEVLDRMQHLDGRYFGSASLVSIESMLGIIQPGDTYHPDMSDDTLLDSSHEFWQDYEQPIKSESDAREEVQIAIKMLRNEGRFIISELSEVDLSGVAAYIEPQKYHDEGVDIQVEQVNDSQMILKVNTDKGVFETTLTRA